MVLSLSGVFGPEESAFSAFLPAFRPVVLRFFANFAPHKMSIRRKRQFAARVLLSVFIPIMLLAILHRHPESEPHGNACVMCLNHVHHPGHVSTAAFNVHDCVLCSFLGFRYLLSKVADLPVALLLFSAVVAAPCPALCRLRCGIKVSRAPPLL